MGRHKLPTALLEARGAFKANPQRRRDQEPQGSPIELSDLRDMAPPGYIPADVLDIAQRFICKALPGVVQSQDAAHLLQMATLWNEFIADPIFFPAGKHTLLNRLLSLTGFNPADRSNISLPKPKGSARFD